jgi:hypothetical protein
MFAVAGAEILPEADLTMRSDIHAMAATLFIWDTASISQFCRIHPS